MDQVLADDIRCLIAVIEAWRPGEEEEEEKSEPPLRRRIIITIDKEKKDENFVLLWMLLWMLQIVQIVNEARTIPDCPYFSLIVAPHPKSFLCVRIYIYIYVCGGLRAPTPPAIPQGC